MMVARLLSPHSSMKPARQPKNLQSSVYGPQKTYPSLWESPISIPRSTSKKPNYYFTYLDPQSRRKMILTLNHNEDAILQVEAQEKTLNQKLEDP